MWSTSMRSSTQQSHGLLISFLPPCFALKNAEARPLNLNIRDIDASRVRTKDAGDLEGVQHRACKALKTA